MVCLHLNEALIGPPEGAYRRICWQARDLHKYPITLSDEATAAVARYWGVNTSQVLLTTGVDEAVDLSLLAFGDAWTVNPGFSGFSDRARALRRQCRLIQLDPNFDLPAHTIDSLGVGTLVLLASPNNPTGHVLNQDRLLCMLRRGVYLFLDETYGDFTDRAPGLGWLCDYNNLIVFRSFSKSFGLAALRIGCVLGAPEVIRHLRTHKAFYTVDGLSLAALVGVLNDDPDYPIRLASCVRARRRELITGLQASHVFKQVYESEANFVLCICRQPGEASQLRVRLLQAGVLVAETETMGVANGLRISVGTQEDQECLLSFLAGWQSKPEKHLA